MPSSLSKILVQNSKFVREKSEKHTNTSLVERRQQKTKIMYHGTSDVFFDSIMKNGLLANPPKQVYADDPDGLESLGGVYLAFDKSKAASASVNAKHKFGGRSLVVTVQYVVGSGNLDEDIITGAFAKQTKIVLETIFGNNELWGDEIEEEIAEYYKKNESELIKNITNKIFDDISVYGKPNKRFYGYLYQAVEIFLDNLNLYDLYFEYMKEIRNDYEFMELIQKLMESINDDVQNPGKTVQIKRNIGFRGKTKILKIEMYPSFITNKSHVMYQHSSFQKNGDTDDVEEMTDMRALHHTTALTEAYNDDKHHSKRRNDLIERRQQKTRKMYHGTSDVFLDSILKNGLLADPPKRAYSADPGDDNYNEYIGSDTFDGVYLSSSQYVAEDAAYYATNKFGGEPLVITVQYVVGSGNLDEDFITNALANRTRVVLNSMFDDELDLDGFDKRFNEYYEKNESKLIEAIANEVIETLSRYGTPNKMFYKYLLKTIKVFLDGINLDELYRDEYMQSLRYYSNFEELVQKLMQSINDDFSNSLSNSKSVQIMRNIGFRGKTKIIKIEKLLRPITDGMEYPYTHIIYQHPSLKENNRVAVKKDNLVERRQQKTRKMYHGTSDVFLDSILKNGLLADPPKRAYGSNDEDEKLLSLLFTKKRGLDTFGGVYLSSDDMQSIQAAFYAKKRFGGKPLIITVQYVVGSGNIDEDHITNELGIQTRTVFDSIFNHRKYGEIEEEIVEYYKKNESELIETIANKFIDAISKFGKPNKVFYKYLLETVKVFLDGVDLDDLSRNEYMKSLRYYSNFEDLVQKLMESIDDNFGLYDKSVQIMRNIGFRGKTKIIKIERLLRPSSYENMNSQRTHIIYKHPSLKENNRIAVKEVNLIERRRQKTRIMYHGTSDTFFDSIMKHGMLADPPKRVYGGDKDDPGRAGYETFGGTYITSIKTDAWGSAETSVEKFGGNAMVVTVQYVVGSGNIDEDHITDAIGLGIRWEIMQFYVDEEMTDSYNFRNHYLNNEEIVIDDIVDDVTKELSKFGKTKSGFFNRYLYDAIKYILDNVNEIYIKQDRYMEILRYDSTFKTIIEKLMRSINDAPVPQKNIQVNRNIGFRGKTKILLIETKEKGVVYMNPERQEGSVGGNVNEHKEFYGLWTK